MGRRSLRTLAGVMTMAASVIGAVGVASTTASALPPNTLYVSTTGTDGPGCGSTPSTACATVDQGIANAVPGDTVKVAAGSYNQTVTIDKAIRLLGAGARSTTLNGAGIDSDGPNYGVVYVGTTGGASEVSGFTITNPFPDTYTGGEPEGVALADTSPADSVVITKNVITEGTADLDAAGDFPIAIDTFQNAATTTITRNTVSGTFQGALLEDNGPATVSRNKVKNLIAVTSDATVFPPEGLFFLSDLSGSITGQDATHNTFSHFAGYGVIMEAGYNNGNCSTTPCNGSISGTIAHNHFALQGATDAAAIDLQAQFAGNDLTATVDDDRGFVDSPSQATVQQSSAGATMAVTQSANHIVVRP
ncbi:MAG: hypothetical protein ACRDY1_05525 [Acidimicrobiales bacterium]